MGEERLASGRAPATADRDGVSSKGDQGQDARLGAMNAHSEREEARTPASERLAGEVRSSARSGTYSILREPRGHQCVEQKRFAALHLQLMRCLSRVCGGEAGFCYAGKYLSTELFVGSMVRGDVLEALPATGWGELAACLFGDEPPRTKLLYHDAGGLHAGGSNGHWWCKLSARLPGPMGGPVLVLPLCHGCELHGVVGLMLRSGRDLPLLGAEVERIEATLTLLTDTFVRHQELVRWLDVSGHLASFDGACAVVRNQEQLLWVGSRCGLPELEDCIRGSAGELIRLVRRCSSQEDSQPPPSYPGLRGGTVVHVAGDKRLATFGGESHGVVAIRPHRLVCPEDDAQELSNRENQVARLLARGYTIVNAAAILGVSENTVRTYVRRLYRKLRVSCRADLVRQLHLEFPGK